MIMNFIKLRIFPEANIFYDEKSRTYKVIALPAKLKIITDKNDYFPEGWCLIKGVLKRKGKNLKVTLEVNNNKYPIPVSCKGTIQELIKIPRKIKEIYFEPMNSIGEFEVVEDFYLKSVNNLERKYRMLRRVIFFLKKRFSLERKILGLSFYTPLLNLQKAYELANRIRDCNSEMDYSDWIEIHGKLTRDDIKKIIKDLKKGPPKIKFQILIFDKDKEELENTIKSLNGQLYKNFTIEFFETFSKIGLKKLLIKNDLEKTYLIFLRSGTVLTSHALYWIAKEAEISEADLIYTDHDYITSENKKNNPQFKPDFSLEYLRATNYINYSFAVKAELLSKLEDLDISILKENLHGLLLRLTEKTSNIRHIPAVLFHLPQTTSTQDDKFLGKNPVKEHLERMRVHASVEKIDSQNYKVIYHVIDCPLITIIIPTRNQFEIIKNCIESIFNKTTYKNYEVIIVDNQSNDIKTIEYLKSLSQNSRVRILSYDKPYNFSAINNFAVKEARGEVLLFLNNDTEVITPQWLEIMLGCLQQPKVGAVGVKLYYPSGQIQHAGVVVGPGGCADHVFKGLDKSERGYMDRAILQQEYSAVTAACMMTWKSLFIQVGGFDEENLPISFNDLDYCLKLREASYRVIFTPYVELYHYESLSRGKDTTPEAQARSKREADYIRKKWGKYINHDPYYNPNLNYKKPDFTLNLFPKIKKPWIKNGF